MTPKCPAKPRRCVPWTKADLDRLKQDWGKTPPEVLARDLNRTVCAIQTKASALGLTRPQTKTRVRAAQAAALKALPPPRPYEVGITLWRLSADGDWEIYDQQNAPPVAAFDTLEAAQEFYDKLKKFGDKIL